MKKKEEILRKVLREQKKNRWTNENAMGTFRIKYRNSVMDLVMLRYSVQVKSAYPPQMLRKNFQISCRCKCVCVWFFFSLLDFLLAFGYMKTVLYLFALHIMESIHFLRFNQKATQGRTRKLNIVQHSTFILDTLLIFCSFLPLDVAMCMWILCDFLSANHSLLVSIHFIRLQFGSTYYILEWFTIWFIISIYLLCNILRTWIKKKNFGPNWETARWIYINWMSVRRLIWDRYVSLFSLSASLNLTEYQTIFNLPRCDAVYLYSKRKFHTIHKNLLNFVELTTSTFFSSLFSKCNKDRYDS